MQAESGLGLDAQRKQIEGWCATHEATLVDVEVDGGFSARSLDRPGLQSALRRLHSGEADTLLVAKLDRLTRSVRDLDVLLTDHFAKLDLVSVAESIDTRTAGGRFFINLLGLIAQWERETIGERVTAAMKSAVDQGYSTGKLPLGYRAEGGQKAASGKTIKRSIVIDEYGVEIVRRIFTLRAANRSLPWIARTIAAFDTQTGRAWSVNSVNSILFNEMYLGRIEWGKRSKNNSGIRRQRDDLRILTDEEWNAAHAHDRANRANAPKPPKNPRGAQPKYLLSGLIECPGCGGSLVVTGGKRWANGAHLNYFHCNRAKQLKTCDFRTLIRVDRITSGVVAHLQKIMVSEESREVVRRTLEKLLAEYVATANAKAGPDPIAKLEALEAQVRRLIDIQIAGDASPYLVEKRKQLEAEIEAWRPKAALHPSRLKLPTWADVEPLIATTATDLEGVLGTDLGRARATVRRVLGGERLKLHRDEQGRLVARAHVYPLRVDLEVGTDGGGSSASDTNGKTRRSVPAGLVQTPGDLPNRLPDGRMGDLYSPVFSRVFLPLEVPAE